MLSRTERFQYTIISHSCLARTSLASLRPGGPAATIAYKGLATAAAARALDSAFIILLVAFLRSLVTLVYVIGSFSWLPCTTS